MVKKNTQSEPVVMFDVIGKKKEQTIQISAKIQNRFAISGVWLKGTLHCHSDRPGNKEWLFGIVEHYKNMGYDYIVGMDHDKIVPLKSDADFVVIPGAEISCGGHLIALGIHEIPEGIQGETRCITISHMIGKIKKMGGFTVLAHPFKSGYKYQELIELCEAGLDGIETVNSNVRGKGADEGRADQIWQMLLRDGWNLTPFGNDDAHGPHENYIESGWGGIPHVAWTGLLVEEFSTKGILEAIKSKRTYASEGPVITRIAFFENATLRVDCSSCVACHLRSFPSGSGLSVYPAQGQAFAETFVFDLATGGYRLGENIVIVLQDEYGRRAWSGSIPVNIKVSPVIE